MKIRNMLIGLLALPMMMMAQVQVAHSISPGPYKAELIKVIDADTLRVMVEVWPLDYKRVDVRISGVDTPEKRGSGCRALYGGKAAGVPVHIKERENQLGREATAFVKARVEAGATVVLTQVKQGKYVGRVVAQLALPTGEDLGVLLVESGHAVPYDGGTKVAPWCTDP
ncbi:thermonuclease family protein [Pseudovibrio denitrificans]|uniref:thermonuclease family protein n=1 Tax=Pseudovibrio denitrificans TaxID=258256 RepID=UPI0039BEF408